MDQVTWLFLGTIAVLLTAATLYTNLEDILGGLVAMVAWAFWALGATNVEIVRGGQSEMLTQTHSYTSLALFGAGMAAFCALTMLAGAATLLDVRDEGFIDGQQRGQR